MQPYRLPDGYTIDVRQPERTVENDFMVDRETQRTTTFTGIPGGPADQDRAMTETMEPVLDRSNEHLGTTDVAIVAMRRKLLRLAHDLEKGVEPPMANLGSVVFHALDVASDKEDFDEVVAAHADELLGASGATFV